MSEYFHKIGRSIGTGVTAVGNRAGSRSWTTRLYNEGDLQSRLDSRTGNVITSSVGDDSADVYVPEFINVDTERWVGDKTRSVERFIDGGNYTLYFKFKQLADIDPDSAAADWLGRFGKTHNTAATERGISFVISYERIQPYISDGTTRIRPYLVSALNTNIKPLDYAEIMMHVNYTTKRWIINCYNHLGAIIATVDEDISSLVFNNDNNTSDWWANSKYFVFTNLKKFSAIKTIEQCRDNVYITDLQLWYPMIKGGVDVTGNGYHLVRPAETINNTVYTNLNSYPLDYGCQSQISTQYPLNTQPNLTVCNLHSDKSRIVRDYEKCINIHDGGVLHNLCDSYLEFSNDFFDRSNVTIWNDKARRAYIGIIYPSGTSGSMTVTVNGVVKTITFDTDIETTINTFLFPSGAPTVTKSYADANIKTCRLPTAIAFETFDCEGIYQLEVANASGDLDATIELRNHYNLLTPKRFHSDEINQRTFFEYLNDGYRGRLYCKVESLDYGTVPYYGSVEKMDRRNIIGIYLYQHDIKGADQLKVLAYTGDLRYVASDVTYDTDGYVLLGYYQATKPMCLISMDDALISEWEGWIPLFRTIGSLPYNLNNHSDFTDAESVDHMSWDQLRAAKAEGADIGAQNLNDNDYSLMTYAEIEYDITQNKLRIDEEGLDCKHLQGNRRSCESPVARFLSWKTGHQTFRAHSGLINTNHGVQYKVFDKYAIGSMALDTGGGNYYDISSANGDPLRATKVARIKEQMDIATTENGFLVLYFHNYSRLYTEYHAAMSEVLQYWMGLGHEFYNYNELLSNCAYLSL